LRVPPLFPAGSQALLEIDRFEAAVGGARSVAVGVLVLVDVAEEPPGVTVFVGVPVVPPLTFTTIVNGVPKATDLSLASRHVPAESPEAVGATIATEISTDCPGLTA